MMNFRRRQLTGRLSWRLIEGHWTLLCGSVNVASIVGGPGGYVTFIRRHDELGWDAVDSASLAQAKAILLRWWSQRTTFRLAARHYGIGRDE